MNKNELLELEILKHVEQTPRLNNRLAASKLGCSVKLAHALLGKMVDRGLLHVRKLHSRRWDYFLTPRGIAEKARITYEFLDFSMQFYHEARRESSKVCRKIAETGNKTVAFLGAGDLAEIVYLGIREWNLQLIGVYGGNGKKDFLGHRVRPHEEMENSGADAIIVCLYERNNPLNPGYLPENIPETENMYWIFQTPTLIDTTPMENQIKSANRKLSHSERMKKFVKLQNTAYRSISEDGYRKYIRRNMKQRAIQTH